MNLVFYQIVLEDEFMEQFDVIVVGAGTGGCLAAKTVSKAGFSVCIIERKKKWDIGDKICGDAIGKHHFDNLDLEYPSNEIVKNNIIGGKIYSPDLESVFTIEGAGLPGFIVDRRLFGQELLRSAVEEGSNLKTQVQVLKPLIKKEGVEGVLARNLKNSEVLRFQSKIVVDASGTSAVIRKNLPDEFGLNTEINREDFVVCYREIRELKKQAIESDFIELYINQDAAPGGYYWIFPAGDKRVNVGLGVGMQNNFPNPRRKFYNFVLSQSIFSDSIILNGGGGQVPTRQPLSCMTEDNVLVVGDAAYQVNPIHGGGLGSSMLGGTLAGNTIIEALEKSDTSQEGLWGYNINYMDLYGKKQAGLDVFRIFLQSLDNEDLNYGMKYSLITEADLLKTSLDGEVNLNITEKTRRLFRGRKKIALLRRLQHTSNLMKSIKKLYANYPTSSLGFNSWKTELDKIMEKVKTTL
jgi:geranylgeranyl reductase family protein